MTTDVSDEIVAKARSVMTSPSWTPAKGSALRLALNAVAADIRAEEAARIAAAIRALPLDESPASERMRNACESVALGANR